MKVKQQPTSKDKGGRPTLLRDGHPFQLRVDDEFLRCVDRWRGQQPNPPTRSAAIREMIKLAYEQT